MKRKTRKPLWLIKLSLKTKAMNGLKFAFDEMGKAVNKATTTIQNLCHYMDLQDQLLNPIYEVQDEQEN